MSRRLNGLKIVALLVIGAVMGLCVFASHSSFYLASGSDAGIDILTPALTAKVCAGLLALGTFIGAFFARRPSMATKVATCLAGITLLAIATHSIVLNHKRGMIEEYWLLYPLDRGDYDQSEGVLAEWQIHKRAFGLELRRQRDGRSIFVFTGFPPFRIDPMPALMQVP